MTQALSQRERALCDLVAARREALLRDLERFVAIPTGRCHSPGLDDLRGQVCQRLERLGAKVERAPGDAKPDWLFGDERGAGAIPPVAICRRARAGAATRVLLASHLDTVFDPADDFRTLSIAPGGATATGPGCVDMKGGIVIALHALEALEESGVNASWTYLFNSDEETGSFHSDRALREEAGQHDAGLATEPALAGGELAISRMGSGQFRIDAKGVAAHVGRAFYEGVNAVHALAGAIVRVDAIAKGPPPRIVSVGPMAGGGATNVVPDAAVCWGNARFESEAEAAEIGARLDALATPADATPRIQVRRAFNRPPKPEQPATRTLATLARAAAEDLGQRLPFASTGGVCDGNNMQAAGLPTIDTLGARGGGLHTTAEWIEIPSLVERCALVAILLARLAEQPFSPA